MTFGGHTPYGTGSPFVYRRQTTVKQYGFTIPGIENTNRYPEFWEPLFYSKQYGATWVRFDLPWNDTETSEGVYDFSEFDPIVARCQIYGLNVLMILAYNNELYAADFQDGISTTENRDAYVAWATAAVDHFKTRGVHTWEVWNEPNLPQFWGPTVSASDYTDLLVQTYPAIKAADPTATVLGGVLAPAATPGRRAYEFLEDMYTAGAAGFFDHLSHHPYTDGQDPKSTATPSTAWSQMNWTTVNLRKSMIANGDGSKKIWCTEFGAPTAGAEPFALTEAEQAALFVTALRLWKTYPWAGNFFAYAIQNLRDITDLTDRQHNYGFLYASNDPGKVEWSPKPVAAKWRRAVTS